MRALLLLFLWVSSFHLLAQNVRVGATTALNATFVLDQGLSQDPRYNSTYTYNLAPVGFNFGIDIGRKFGLQMESILSNQGQIYQLVNVAEQVAGERRIDLQYLQLPLMMKFMSGGAGGVRGNFNLGPQLSLLTRARETLQAQAGTFAIPDGVDFADIQAEFPGAVFNPGDNTYTLPSDLPSRDLLSKELNNFRNTEFAIAAAFGLDIDLSRHLLLTTQIRANYSLTDMRNGDVIDAIRAGNSSDIFGARANLLVGVQLGLHYSFGVLRSKR